MAIYVQADARATFVVEASEDGRTFVPLYVAAPVDGWMLFADVPSRHTITGAALMAGSGIYTAWRERVLHREITPPSPSSTV